MANTIDTKVLERLGIQTTGRTAPATSQEKDKLGQADFLKLMMAQMKNQDPMKPMDDGNFLAQIAQFSTASGVEQMQKSFGQFAASMQSSQALQASALVGRSVLAPVHTMPMNAGQGLRGAIDLPQSVSEVKINVTSSSGQVVRTLQLGQQAAGLVGFSWDGKNAAGEVMPAGKYKVTATTSVDGKPLALNTLLTAQVDSVSLGEGGSSVTLNLAGAGPMTLGQVRQIM